MAKRGLEQKGQDPMFLRVDSRENWGEYKCLGTLDVWGKESVVFGLITRWIWKEWNLRKSIIAQDWGCSISTQRG